jgi:hypothetical protein
MQNYKRSFQLNADSFTPFNEAPAYLKGSVKGTDDDKIIIAGTSQYQVTDWYKIGCKTCTLNAHSFAFSVNAIPYSPVGSYSIGIHGECSINIAHFIRSSVSRLTPDLAENAYSGWAWDNHGSRSQLGCQAPWESIGRRHNLSVQYDASSNILSCAVNGFPIHFIQGTLKEFSLVIRFEAVGIAGNFDVCFENLCYYSFDNNWSENISKLKAWDTQYAPVFVSYSHADKKHIEPFLKRLKMEGVRVLGDWDFKPGDSLQNKISNSISRAGYLLAFLSKQSVSSQWVAKELEIGMARELKTRKVYVLPILIEDCEIPPFLETKLYGDFREAKENIYDSLLETLRKNRSW